MLTIVAVVAAAGLAASDAPPGRPFDPAARAAVIAPFIDEQTIGVAHIDVRRVNLDAIGSLFLKTAQGGQPASSSTQTAVKEITAELERVGQWMTDFTKAGGAEVYLVASIADLPERDKPFIIVPLAPGADARAIAGLICGGRPSSPTSLPAGDSSAAYPNMVSERIGQAVFAGARETLERLRTMKAAPRPELVKAFEAAGDTAGQVLVIPTADSRRVIDEMIPTLPEQVGGGPVTALTRGVMWAAVGVETRPGVSVRMTVQSPDAEAARSLNDVIGKILDLAVKDVSKSEGSPNHGKVFAALRPTLAGDRLTLSLDRGRLEDMVGGILSPLIADSREKAKRMASASNVKQLVMGCLMYGADFKGEWPKDLQTVIDKKYIQAVALVSPLQPERKDAYVYLKPSTKIDRTDAMTPLIYEAFDTWGEGTCVGFADGHVELVKDEKRFKTLLAKAKRTETKPE